MDEACDRLGSFLDLAVRLRAILCRCIDDAVSQMILEQAEGNSTIPVDR